MNDVNQSPIAAYKEEVAQYTKKDAIHAILFFVGITLAGLIEVAVVNYFDLPGNIRTAQISKIIWLVILILYLKGKKQKLHTVGLHLSDWKKPLAVGLIFVFLSQFGGNGIFPGIFGGWQMNPASLIIEMFIILLFAAFWEDVVYVGFVQTRIYGLIKKDWLAITLGAVIFTTMHYPMLISQAISSGEGFGFEFWSYLAFRSIPWFIMHILFNDVFRQLRSIIPVTLLHFSGNFAGFGSFWNEEFPNFYVGSVTQTIVTLLSMSIIWWILPYLNKRKAAKQKTAAS